MNTTFSAIQYEMCYPDGIEFHWWTISRSRFLSGIVKAENAGNAAFLEVGCGRGVEVKALRDAGIDVYGVELAEVPPLKGLEGFVKSGVDAVLLPKEERARITGLLLLDVIEHLPDPCAFLKELEASFPNLSVVIIAVPASQEIWSNYDVVYGHYRRYSTTMLQELATALGWEQKRSGYFFHLLYIPARLLCWFGADRQTVIQAPGPKWRWLHRLISYVNRLDNFIFPAQIRGTSAYAVFRLKPEL